MIDIETWTRPVDNPEDSYVYPMDKAVILNIKKYIPESFEKAMKKDPDMLEKLKTFAIERTAFQNKTKDICNYVDYFIEQYDEDKELPLAYLSLKQIIDDEKYQLTAQEFQKLLYKRLFSPRLKKAIYRLVHDKFDLRRVAHVNGARQFPPDIAFRALKAFNGILLHLLVPEHADVCFTCLQVRSHFDSYYGSHGRYTGILDPIPEDVAQFPLNFSVNPCILDTVLSHNCSFFTAVFSEGSAIL